jgi:hypothetical protein
MYLAFVSCCTEDLDDEDGDDCILLRHVQQEFVRQKAGAVWFDANRETAKSTQKPLFLQACNRIAPRHPQHIGLVEALGGSSSPETLPVQGIKVK